MKDNIAVERIVPNIVSDNLPESKKFYCDLVGMKLVMDMNWILTFASQENDTAQITVIKSESTVNKSANTTFISIEISDVDGMYKKTMAMKYEIIYPITNEPLGVRRFFVKDPNGATINFLAHIS